MAGGARPALRQLLLSQFNNLGDIAMTLAEMRAKLLAQRAATYDNAAMTGCAGGQALRHGVQLAATCVATGLGTLGNAVKGFYVGARTETREPEQRASAGKRAAAPQLATK